MRKLSVAAFGALFMLSTIVGCNPPVASTPANGDIAKAVNATLTAIAQVTPSAPVLKTETPVPTAQMELAQPKVTTEQNKAKLVVQAEAEIYLLDTDGTKWPARELFIGITDDDGIIGVSPDLGQVMFYRDSSLFIANTDGSAPKSISFPGQEGWEGRYLWQVSWSPNRQYIAMIVHFSEDTIDVLIVNADGSGMKNLAGNIEEGRVGWVEWSPDSSKLAFLSTSSEDLSDLYVIDTQGSGLKKLTQKTISPLNLAPSWSHDGGRISFSSVSLVDPDDEVNLSKCHLVVVDADGSNQEILFSGLAISWSAWSPDDSQILFVGKKHLDDPAPANDIYVIDADGSNLRNLTNAPTDYGLVGWSPDGSQIAFVADAPNSSSSSFDIDIFIMNADGSEKKKLNNDPLDGRTGVFWLQ